MSSDRRSPGLLVVITFLLAVTATPAYAQNDAAQPPQLPPSEILLERLPREMRGQAKKLVRLPLESQQRLESLSDEDLRAAIASQLSLKPEASHYLIKLLATESSPKVRLGIISRWSTSKHWRTNSRIQPLLERMVESDQDTDVSLRALEVLRSIRMGDLSRLLDERLEMARRLNDQAAWRQMAKEQERWISLKQGVMLASFLRAVPVVFSVKPADQPLRVLAFGDFGTGSEEQKEVARAILRYHQQLPFDCGITLGDNFYPSGMTSPTDERWKTEWEDLYSPLGIKFYAALGNHDWYGSDSPAAEVLYSGKSETWRMPAPYYTFTAGPVQFFALDTNEISEAQLVWLKEELMKSRARWKLVYGHHPIYSSGRYSEDPKLTAMVERLLPILQGQVDVYLCGHDHNLQHLRTEGSVHFFISGGGGAGLYPTRESGRALFRKETYGFTVIEADQQQLKLKFIDKDGTQLYENHIQK